MRQLLRPTLNHGWYIFTPPYLDHFIAAADSFTILSDRESRSLLRDVIQHRQIGPKVTARKMQAGISRMK